VLGHQRTGVYANSRTIEWALQDGLGSFFWQHNWGSPGGVAHPAVHLHQVEIDARSVGGVGVDFNHILKPSFGQWDKTLPISNKSQQTFSVRGRSSLDTFGQTVDVIGDAASRRKST
jgi:hypothetical protein